MNNLHTSPSGGQPAARQAEPMIKEDVIKPKRSRWVHISMAEQIFFAKRLAILLKAGIPLLDALSMLEKQAKGRTMKNVLGALKFYVTHGQSLAVGMKQFGRAFGDLTINLVRIGEQSGTLAENLAYLADTLKKKQALRRKVVGALVYPIVIVIATFGITGILMIYVFPKILPIFASLRFELPWTTRLLIVVSNVLVQYGGWILTVTALVVVLAWLVVRLVRSIRYAVQRTVLTLPLLGHLSQYYQVATFCRTMSVLLRCGVVIVEAARITAEATPNLVYRAQAQALAEHLTKGEKISTHLANSLGLWPVDVAQMVSVGEATGNLGDTLMYLSETYEAELDEQTKNLTTLIEPVLMVCMGLVVGFIAVSIIMPIYQVTQYVNAR
ncbi:MAG: type II secretion system F family protein [Candidatus Veblenbacteria bacterium]|nr:type II secretion system F family protein [Candidatus Veblenbacteria bacterium]